MLKLVDIEHGRGLVPAAEAVVSVDPDPRLGDPWTYRMTDRMFDRYAGSIDPNWLEHKEAGRGEPDWRTET